MQATRFVLLAIRNRIYNTPLCSSLLTTIEKVFGPDLDLFLSAIDRYSRRRLTVYPPQASQQTADEIALVNLIAAAQRQDWTEFQARCAWLINKPGLEVLRFYSHAVAARLDLDALTLNPETLRPKPTPPRQPAVYGVIAAVK